MIGMAAALLTFKRYPPPQILSRPVRRKSQLDRVQRLKHGRMTIAIFRALTPGLPGGHGLFIPAGNYIGSRQAIQACEQSGDRKDASHGNHRCAFRRKIRLLVSIHVRNLNANRKYPASGYNVLKLYELLAFNFIHSRVEVCPFVHSGVNETTTNDNPKGSFSSTTSHPPSNR